MREIAASPERPTCLSPRPTITIKIAQTLDGRIATLTGQSQWITCEPARTLAHELGRIVSEREAAVPDAIRNPDRITPIRLPIGGSYNSREADPTYLIESAYFEKQNPRQQAKLPPPNPELVARGLLTKAGYESTDLDAVTQILQSAAQSPTLENRFKGTPKQSDWKQP